MGLGYYLSIQLNYFETTARHELQQLHDVLDRSVLLETEIVAFAGYLLRPDAQAYAVGPFDARDDFGQRDVIEGDDPVTDQQQVAHGHFVDFEQLGVGVIDGLASATGSPLKERTLKTVPNTRTRNAGAVTTKGCPASCVTSK